MSGNSPPVILIGPGGVGKGTVARALVAQDPSLWLSRSWTTRQRRVHETDHDYNFVSRSEFQEAIQRDVFLEWAEFHGNLYGTPVPTQGPGQRALLEIEVQGASQVLAREPNATVILLEPPSLEELSSRLRSRGDHDDHVTRRLKSTPGELEIGRNLAHHVIINDDVQRAVSEILSILKGPR